MLNEMLARELVRVLRYRRYFFITKPSQTGVKPSFLRFAHVHQEQADRIAERMVQLGGSPFVDTSELAARSHSRFAAGKDLQDMVGEDLLFVRKGYPLSSTKRLSRAPGPGGRCPDRSQDRSPRLAEGDDRRAYRGTPRIAD
jgi:Ferritin-like domain